MRQRATQMNVGPTVGESINGFSFSDIERVVIYAIDFGKGLDQICRVRLVTTKPGPNRMCIDRNVQLCSNS